MKSILRTDECFDKLKAKEKELGELTFDLRSLEVGHSWKFWMLAKNQFPYDKIAERHSLLIPFRLFAEDDEMTDEEREELFLIKKEYRDSGEFDVIMEHFKRHRTIPEQFHLHFIRYKKVEITN